MPNIIGSFDGEYFFLSNFSVSSIMIEGIKYPTVEHAFQAQKTLSQIERIEIANSETPGIAKRKGRRVTLREDWEKVKDGIMELCLREKFDNHLELREKLIATEKAFLVEGNTWNDTYWGVCDGKGKNTLGALLMKIRSEYRKEISNE